MVMKTRRWALASAVACGSLWAGVAQAQPTRGIVDEAGASDGSFEEVDLLDLLNVEVSTATKTAQSVADAPAIITVITSRCG